MTTILPREVLDRINLRLLGNTPNLHYTDFFVSELCAHGVRGDMVECGVAAGCHPAVMALGLDVAEPGSDRKVYLLDSFQGIPRPGPKDIAIRGLLGEGNGELISTGISACSLLDVQRHMAEWGVPETRLRYLQGWFQDTVPVFRDMMRKWNQSISFLRLDGDLYESVKVCLAHLAPLVSIGGVIVLDDHHLDGAQAAAIEWASWVESARGWKPVFRDMEGCGGSVYVRVEAPGA